MAVGIGSAQIFTKSLIGLLTTVNYFIEVDINFEMLIDFCENSSNNKIF